MEYHVAKTGSDQGSGSRQQPFLTISRAAEAARAGDTVIVHEGVYREWVKPKYKGRSGQRRIVYQAADGEKAVIKGSERIQDWQQVEGSIWKAVLPNTFFGGYNPYMLTVSGDWLVTLEETRHLGEVYLNGMSFYEVSAFEALKQPEVRTQVKDHCTGKLVPVKNKEQTAYVWYTETDEFSTTIYANFQGADPNRELTEINVRRSCFYPEETGIDYITVKGFEMAHAATPWAPPTADQPGLIGPNWSKGWIIEDNIIHDAKCSAVSIGKEISTGHNYCTVRGDKPGYQYQLEAVFAAERNGWSREKTGSHIIRGNTIYDCGQNAVVGHLGGVFSEIYNNHIYRIGIKREFFGYEIAGIKLHAAIDVQICRNRIHDCSLGLWLDWEAQGTRVSRNLFYQNERDFFVEVSHGPYLVEHNIMASGYAIENASQGGAYVNNLICGTVKLWKELSRSTQYHLPHSTKVAGFSFIYGGDDRFFNNLFIGTGTSIYNHCTASLEEYIETVHKKPGDAEVFNLVEQPAYIDRNAYLAGAEPFDRENGFFLDQAFDPHVEITEQNDGVYLSLDLPDGFLSFACPARTTADLPRTRIVDAEYERPDGGFLILDTDYSGCKKTETSPAGPLSDVCRGKNRVRVWQ